MKKLSILTILLVVFGLLAAPALAAQNATMSVSASNGTVHRGDTFTVTVSTTAVENCTSAGFMFNFDQNVFDYVTGSALQGGFAMAGVSTANGNLAGYLGGGDATVQGALFQITLKVKDSAAFGSYTISGSASLSDNNGAVSCGVSSATVAVSCNHNWSEWTGTQATCSAAGSLTRTCSSCGATDTDAPAATGNHTYGNWSNVNDTQHKHSCSVCGKEESANHSWDNGLVTKQPTCKEDGIITFGCTECSAIKTEVLEKLTTHTYDHACDTDCNVCGVTRTITHDYKSTWSKDGQNHWHECSVCKDQKDVAAHTPGAEATEYNPQTCTTCGHVIKAALGHKHIFDSKLTTDEKGHWYACSGCNEKNNYADHDFENDCDADCSICQYTREIEHAFSETWSTDDTSHWLVCSICGLEKDKAAHVPGPEATATTAQTCTICDYEIAPALGEPETTTEATQPTTTESEAPAVDDEGGFQAWIIFVAVAVVAAGAGVVVIVKTKKV